MYNSSHFPLTLSLFTLSLISHNSWANALPNTDNSKLETPAIAAQQHSWQEQLNNSLQANTSPASSNPAPEPITLNNEDLSHHPELLHELLTQALNQTDVSLIESLIEAYRQLPQPDPILLTRAEGMIARYQGNYRLATQTYQHLHQQHPNDERIALDTAAILFEDKQWRESQQLFDHITTHTNLPQPVVNNIALYQKHIRAASQWQFNGNVHLSHDKNINNAAPSYCTYFGCVSETPINATGIHYHFSAEKNTPIKGHHNLLFRGQFSGTSYYFDHQSGYDHAFGRTYLGWQYQNAHHTFNLLPFYQWQLSGSNEWADKTPKNHTLNMDMFSHATGLHGSWTHRITPRLQSYLSAEWYRQNYRSAEKAHSHDGNHYSLFGSLAYQIQPNHLIFAGLSNGIFRPDNASLYHRPNHTAFTRNGVHLGWLANWSALGNLTTHLRASYTDRRYQGTVFNTQFKRQRQHNKETVFSASLSHPKISYKGFTPKLSWEKSHLNSSHQWAERKQQRVFLEIEKTF